MYTQVTIIVLCTATVLGLLWSFLRAIAATGSLSLGNIQLYSYSVDISYQGLMSNCASTVLGYYIIFNVVIPLYIA